MSPYYDKNILKIDPTIFFSKKNKVIFLNIGSMEKLKLWKIIYPIPPFNNESLKVDSVLNEDVLKTRTLKKHLKYDRKGAKHFLF